MARTRTRLIYLLDALEETLPKRSQNTLNVVNTIQTPYKHTKCSRNILTTRSTLLERHTTAHVQEARSPAQAPIDSLDALEERTRRAAPGAVSYVDAGLETFEMTTDAVGSRASAALSRCREVLLGDYYFFTLLNQGIYVLISSIDILRVCTYVGIKVTIRGDVAFFRPRHSPQEGANEGGRGV